MSDIKAKEKLQFGPLPLCSSSMMVGCPVKHHSAPVCCKIPQELVLDTVYSALLLVELVITK